MASQAICCGDPDSALTFTELALVRADRLTATEQAMLHTVRAHALAKLGRVQDAVAAVGVADEEFSRAHPADDPAWMAHHDAALHTGETGGALWHLAVHGQFVGEARHHLDAAVAGYRESHVRARAHSQIKLASLVMVTGDRRPAEATVLGTRALDAAGTLRSRRAADDLRELRRLGQPHEHLTEVAEQRHRIGMAVAAVAGVCLTRHERAPDPL